MFDLDESAADDFRRGPQPDALRVIRKALKRERRHTERLLNGLLVAINAEIGRVEERMLTKLEDIDTSVSLVARKLARRDGHSPSKDEDMDNRHNRH